MEVKLFVQHSGFLNKNLPIARSLNYASLLKNSMTCRIFGSD